MDNKLFVEYCKEKLDLENAVLSHEYYYMSLPLCVIDAVYSIGIRYEVTKKVVDNFCKCLQLKKYREYGSDFASIDKQLSIDELIEIYNQNDISFITSEIYKNRCRTSTRNGILKSEAVLEFAKVLQKFNVNYFQDLSNVITNKEFSTEIKKIKGQKSGISLTYFFMLAGNDDFIKLDRMVCRFVKEAIGKELSINDIEKLVYEAFDVLKSDFPNLTLRKLDHEIWKFQKDL
ncbi:hypothetical protein [Nitrosophilus alvini]|uniref:hypothetical protein n=1 Tax=Nitrosophilus alvini TaxID=2714855 RepID=UPI001909902E|nr:hypothetical protein [Nitrosophilus alvini]